MKKSILVLVILVLLLALIPGAMVQAKKPLSATTTYWYVGGPDVDGTIISWKGYISGDINGTIRWGPLDPPYFVITGQASHYTGWFEIWDGGVLLLAGEDHGSTTVRHGKNSNWRTNGVVTYASSAYVDWVGRRTHQSGNFIWAAPGVPLSGESEFRIN